MCYLDPEANSKAGAAIFALLGVALFFATLAFVRNGIFFPSVAFSLLTAFCLGNALELLYDARD